MADTGRHRTALVTDASHGVGAAVELGRARDGFDVAVTDLRTADLGRTVAGLRDIGLTAY